MLAAKYRFHSRGGVNFVRKKGKTIRGKEISLTFCANTRQKTRFAVVVSKKVLKSAVGRNRIRRRVYEAIYKHLEDIKAPTDFIFSIYSKEVKEMPFDDLVSLIRDLLEQANAVK